MTLRSHFLLIVLFSCIVIFLSCEENYAPKPRGYFRIPLPQKQFETYRSGCPFTFQYPIYGRVVTDLNNNKRPCWMNVDIPQFNARIHLSYQPITSKEIFNELVEDAHTFAFKHTVKATTIDEAIIHYPERNVHGIYYTIGGNTASAAQFFVTDSTKNYLRAALYFNEKPQIDSIKPVLDFLKEDLQHMIKTIAWH